MQAPPVEAASDSCGVAALSALGESDKCTVLESRRLALVASDCVGLLSVGFSTRSINNYTFEENREVTSTVHGLIAAQE